MLIFCKLKHVFTLVPVKDVDDVPANTLFPNSGSKLVGLRCNLHVVGKWLHRPTERGRNCAGSGLVDP
jgi:hypothetical protein